MSFTVRDGLVFYASNRPGSFATMFGPGGNALKVRGEHNDHSDAERHYKWAFELAHPLADGQEFVYADDGQDGAGVVVAGKIEMMLEKRPVVVREPSNNAPSRIIRQTVPPIARREKLVTLAKHMPGEKPPRGMRCMMVNPSVPYNQWGCKKVGAMNEASFSAHGMAYVSATLKNAGHDCWLVDLRDLTGWQHTSDVLAAQEFDVAFVGFLSIDCFNAAAVVRLLKELHPNLPVVVGGLHVSIAKEHVFPREDLIDHYLFGNENNLPDVFKDFLGWKGEGKYEPRHFPQADYVILDDGEIAARDLVAEMAAGRTPANRTIDGGAVPMEVARHMDRDLFDLEIEAHSPILPFQPTPMVTVTWARGCPFKCTYSVAGDTLVYTEEGAVRIDSLASGVGSAKACPHGGEVLEYPVGRQVATLNGRGMATVAVSEGVQPVVRVSVDSGESIKVTPGHLLFTVREHQNVWQKAGDLHPGDEVIMKRRPGAATSTAVRVARVVSVEPCLAEPVYDIVVPSEHLFVANGFIAHNCNLSSQLSNTNVRTKPMDLVREELVDLHRRFGGRLGSLMIHDDLTFSTKAISAWCEAILEISPTGIPIWLQTRAGLVGKWYRRDRPFWDLLCRAGLTWTSIGYESGSQRVLDYMKKDSTVEENLECGRILDEFGVNSFGNFLWGVPTETAEEAEATVELVQQIKPGFLSGSIYCSYPGTAQDRAAREQGLIVPGEVYTRSHLPWQYTIKGIDYNHLNDCVRRAGQYANYLRMPKLLHPERQADLAASARGLAIH